jgi:hypothetical protein
MTLAQARKAALYLVLVFVLYSVITFPERATEFVELAFAAISEAGQGVGDMLAELVR